MALTSSAVDAAERILRVADAAKSGLLTVRTSKSRYRELPLDEIRATVGEMMDNLKHNPHFDGDDDDTLVLHDVECSRADTSSAPMPAWVGGRWGTAGPNDPLHEPGERYFDADTAVEIGMRVHYAFGNSVTFFLPGGRDEWGTLDGVLLALIANYRTTFGEAAYQVRLQPRLAAAAPQKGEVPMVKIAELLQMADAPPAPRPPATASASGLRSLSQRYRTQRAKPGGK